MNQILASLLVGLTIPASASVIAAIDTVVKNTNDKNETTPTIPIKHSN